MKMLTIPIFVLLLTVGSWQGPARAEDPGSSLYPVGRLKPTDSVLRVRVGERAPDFALPAVTGEPVRLSDYRGRKNVVLSFIPAAWTPVCSDQWPGYNVSEKIFVDRDTVLLGISVDNVPTLFAWTRRMGTLWFPVLSDFWPHGAVAERYGVLRTDGTAERALFVIDKQGVIRFIDVHDINERPDLKELATTIERIE